MKLTVAQYIVQYLDNQYLIFDKEETKFVKGIFNIFGHGNVFGLGHALSQGNHSLDVIQGKNEQSMALSAMAFAKQKRRTQIYGVTTSIGPGSTNLVTAAACATVNKIPLLLFPSDTYTSRQPDPVLQQIEMECSNEITVNDTLKPVSQYFERIVCKDQIFTALNNAMQVLTDPKRTGTVTIALPQDIQTQIIEVAPDDLKKQFWDIKRLIPSENEIELLIRAINNAEKPVIICGGGVNYSMASTELLAVCKKYNIPYVETQAGKGTTVDNHYNLGGIGVTGTKSANQMIANADLIIGLGTRYTDFTSSSNTIGINQEVINVNLNQFDARKIGGKIVQADIKLVLEALISTNKVKRKINNDYESYQNEWQAIKSKLKETSAIIINDANEKSAFEFANLSSSNLNQVQVILRLNSQLPKDAIIVTASGSLPGDLQRLWSVTAPGSYHVEYGYSCMGYEIAAGLGVKLAEPDRPVFVFVGDGSFLMMHSEMYTSCQLQMPINILLFDNSGYGCINNLQNEYYLPSYQTEFREQNSESQQLILTDYAKIAQGYGLDAVKVNNNNQVQQITNNSKSTLYDIKVLPKTMTKGYDSFWEVGFNGVNLTEKQQEKRAKITEKQKQRRHRC